MSNGRAASFLRKRCETTTWNASPAMMCSRAPSTIAWNRPGDMLASQATPSGPRASGEGASSVRRFSIRSTRATASS